ncbi:putative monovalent cation/H+ antiporter subunit D [Azotobacter vinelandii CA]|uniref:Sodium hydrogen antiporter subunitD, ShaD n=2 Tax=Azotobacter vinelandii TaxID=354 RepID=C1DEH9_AZOVD|nr:monovalent cation/H+ antiporter subunit D [Azotobacter vinelandii]ACO78164.1 sodium hydrogen antiporter subunitD, ShaD [Azotobacter vinelandii DJ]AGK13127.1 putative monovalent cation/H+ antiporter subunit D [Azotobacter vinelandii CA]AGK18807.1 putative monovalent cation/H+ antiporter subunit D [Azotobacter vinelandii CA6]WKN23872.1 monovalent cation/H+ antiporter subunit D [Azotobacter vinelandii]SFX55243.1 multisubunit potassium/proton antiporter, PhaD subunit [Azotobacter vinelandii]
MMHAPILPILLPLFAGSLLLLGHRLGHGIQRRLSLAATWALLPLAVWALLLASDGRLRIYALGDWPAPFGIVLLLDRLSALMLLVTALLAGFALLYAVRGDDLRGPNFHALFQFQLVGINGAFLTADLFNLFVFFEILLIASYALLLHGNGAARVRAGLHYVLPNLLGSAFFLIGIGILYGLTGTLNMADLARRVAGADAGQAPLLATAGYLLLVVFGLKGAILPLHFWLPRAYAAATAPVAALFAIMTKVGLYAILRVFGLIFGAQAGPLAGLAQPWLWTLAVATLAAGVFGVLAARDLQVQLAYLVIVSVGTLLLGLAPGSLEGYAAALYYLLHSTLVAGGLFLLADLVARQRGELGGALQRGPNLHQPGLLGGLFFFGAISVAGLPPLSGFLGKLMLLRAVPVGIAALAIWTVVLCGGLGLLIALGRSGSTLFWRGSGAPSGEPADGVRLLACAGLLSGSLLLTMAAAPVQAYVRETARQLLDPAAYLRIGAGGGA